MASPSSSKSPPPTQSDGTVLPFPDRFHAAVDFVVNPPPGASSINDETRLVLYALNQQAEYGPCKESKPWGWNVVESAKWNSWSQLKDMSSVEAMRLYVKVLEEEVQPDWWVLARGADLERGGAQAAGPSESTKQSLQASARENSWAVVATEGIKQPAPRYDHAAVLVGGALYVIGGNCSGRYLNDAWTLDLETLSWQQLQAASSVPAADEGNSTEPSSTEKAALLQPAASALAGHVLVVWGSSILCIGGHTKGWQSKAAGQLMAVRALDTASRSWSTLTTTGAVPLNRGSHTATLVGDRVYVFGGEDRARRAVADLDVLDLATLAWSSPTTQGGGPSARSAHTAAAVQDRYLLIFGGGSVAHCHNDLWVLDTRTHTWSNPSPRGPPPAPRAGHAGDILGGSRYITGGGNNSSGCGDVVALDVSALGGADGAEAELEWRSLARAAPRAAIASEGLSVCSAPSLGVLVAFGGYNGKYHNDIQVFRPGQLVDEPSSSHRDSQEAEAPPRANSGRSEPTQGVEPLLGKPRSSGDFPREAERLSEPRSLANGHASAQPGISAKAASLGDTRAASLEAVARDAAASREAMLSEMVLMRKQLNRALETKAALEKELSETKAQLSSEHNKVFKLEVELAEARQKLQNVTDLEKELSRYRKIIEEVEKGKGKGGIWNYISGAQ